ncbi:MAG: hypothetical protein JWQ22_2611 [Devosia sp.]|nr:hypothetical protein [Devosia sp.]
MSGTHSPSAPLPWGSLTDVKNLEACPVAAASTVSSIFGPRAASIAAWCAVYARQDGDERGYQLWLSVFQQLKTFERTVRS